VVRLNVIGRPETVRDAVDRLPERIHDDLMPHLIRPEIWDRLEILHEAEIESQHDLGASVRALVDNINRYQGHLAHQWLLQAAPPTDPGRARDLAAGLSTEIWPAATGTPPIGSTDLADPDSVAQAWLTGTPEQRAELMAAMLRAAPAPDLAVQPPTRQPPADLPPGARIAVVAGSAVAAGVVLPTTQLRWYDPSRDRFPTGSMRMLATWAEQRAAGPDDIWYVVLRPTATGATA
jgi:hypothetical protein